MSDKLISVVVPMYFEEEVADECYKRLTTVMNDSKLNYELVFVNDGSTDRTLEILQGIAQKDQHVKVISFSRNFGHQIAVTAGMDKAKGDAVVIIDADLQDPPELIPEMIKLWEAGYDVVYGKRKKRDGETWFKLVTAKLFYRILNSMSSVKIPMDTGDFRLIDKKVAEVMRKMPEHNRFLRGMSSWAGFKQVPLEYERKERFAGETKYPLKKMIKFALDGIFSFSSKPVKLMEYIGSITILTAFLLLIYSIGSSLLGIGRSTLSLVLLLTIITFLGGIQLLSIGVIGEYITRIYDESKGRPIYIVDKELNMNKPGARHLYLVKKDLDMDKGTVKPLYAVGQEAVEDKSYGIK